MVSPLDTSLFLTNLFGAPTSTGNLHLPGATAESAQVLIELLKRNAEHNHVYFNSERRQHNHVMDHLFAAYGLGASPALLKEIYTSHVHYEQPVISSPQEITDATFLQHLGDEKFYGAYLVYFCHYLLSHSPSEAIQKFILSEDFNYAEHSSNDPSMFMRYWAGIIHPHIHLGYGIEFGVAQQIAEGLAMTAVHHPHQAMAEVNMFTSVEDKAIMREINAVILNFELPPTSSSGLSNPRNFLGLSTALLADDNLSQSSLGLKGGPPLGDYGITLRSAGLRIARHVSAWFDTWMDGVPADRVEDQLALMVEDVLLTVTAWYAVAGWGKRRSHQNMHNSFVSMHFVTSSMFVPNLVLANSRHCTVLDPALPLHSRAALLRGFINQCAHWYVTMGRAPIPIAEFYAATDDLVFSKAPSPETRGAAQRNMGTMTQTERYSSPASAWARIWPSIIAHPNEHLVKLIRALGAFSQLYGGRGKGFYAGTHPDGAVVDGTLFVRAATLTMMTMGWVAEGEPTRVWEFTTYVPPKAPSGGPPADGTATA